MKKLNAQKFAAILVALGLTAFSAVAGDREWDSKEIDTKQVTHEQIEPMGRWYVAAFGGASLLANGDGEVNDTIGAGTSTEASVSGGSIEGTAGAKVGYEFAPVAYTGPVAWSPVVELEGSWSNFNASTEIDSSFPFIPIAGNEINADYTAVNLMLNGLMKAKIANWVAPYVGVGVGGAWIERSNAHFSSPAFPGGFGMSSTDDWVLAAQGIGGVDFMLNDRWSLFGEYKFLVFFDPKFSDNSGAVVGVTNDAKYDWLGEHLVTAGVKYHF